jgi:hypothetical protein
MPATARIKQAAVNCHSLGGMKKPRRWRTRGAAKPAAGR